jgi:hypothetical protein
MKSVWENYGMTEAEHDEKIHKLRQELHGFLEGRDDTLAVVAAAMAVVQTDILLTVAPSVEKACTLVRMMAKNMQEDMRTRNSR